MHPRPHILHEATYRQVKEYRPNVAVLPWGATEAHNYHLPHGTDVIEAVTLAERSAQIALEYGARPIVLPAIPFGNNAQQQDQIATVHLGTATAAAILGDVVQSLKRQGIDRVVLLNAHGGNDFRPLIRDVQLLTGSLVVLVNFFQMCPEAQARIFSDPGDHAGQLETSFLLHVCPDLVQTEHASTGRGIPFQIEGLGQSGVWTPRPWTQTHPDTGAGNPAGATADRGSEYVQVISQAIAKVIVGLSEAKKGDLPYV